MKLLRGFIGVLMLISGVTHVVQLAVYEADVSVLVAASFGVLYFIIGLLLLGRLRLGLYLGSIFPAIGGVLGVYRFFFLHSNPFSVFHVIIDLIVVPISIYILTSERRQHNTT